MADESNGPKLIASMWAMTAVSAVFLVFRVGCKFKSGKPIWWDDYILASAWICNLLHAAFAVPAVAKGLGKHGRDVDPRNFSAIAKLFNVMGVFAILGLALSKTSFAVTLLRVGRGPERLVVWFVLVSMNILFFLNIVFLYTRCSPSERIWNPRIHGTCWEAHVFPDFAIAVGAYSGAVDFILTLVSWIIVWNLNIERKAKIGVGLAMSIGFLAGVTAIIKCVQVPTLANVDFTYRAPYLAIWTLAENAVTIIASSIPFLRVLHKGVTSRCQSETKVTVNGWETEGRGETASTFASDKRTSSSVLYPKQDDRGDQNAPSSTGKGRVIVDSNNRTVEPQDANEVRVR